MNKTNIEWCDVTWNPITGCLHDCEYCYARGIAKRFSATETPDPDSLFSALYRTDGLCELSEPVRGDDGKIQAFPNGFTPTLHLYRLDEPAGKKKPKTIFVGSMADMFGEWVPDEWIWEVLNACASAPQHRYLFLTKNPSRYADLAKQGMLPNNDNHWYGSTITTPDDVFYYESFKGSRNRFLSIEPLLAMFEYEGKMWTNWVIIGAETGNRKYKVIPKREWIENILHQCRINNVPVFMKNSLAKIWGEPLIQEFPW